MHSIELHLILDNSSTHKTPEVNRWLETHPRSHLATTSGVAAGTRCYSRDVIVPNAGHMMHLQKGHEVFQREVAGFFKTP